MVPLDHTDVDALAAGEIVLRDGVLGAEAASLVDEARALVAAAAPAGVGRGRRRDPAIRGDTIVWVDPPAPAPPPAPLGGRPRPPHPALPHLPRVAPDV